MTGRSCPDPSAALPTCRSARTTCRPPASTVWSTARTKPCSAGPSARVVEGGVLPADPGAVAGHRRRRRRHRDRRPTSNRRPWPSSAPDPASWPPSACSTGCCVEGAVPDPRYAARRAGAFVVVAECGSPAATCFCTSMGTGPGARVGFDLALTELDDERRSPLRGPGRHRARSRRARSGCPARSRTAGGPRGRATGSSTSAGAMRSTADSRPTAWPSCWPATSSILAGTRWPSGAWPAATAPWSARRASAATCRDTTDLAGESAASAPGHRASTSTTRTCTAGRCGRPPRRATGNGSPTSSRPGGTSSTPRAASAAGAASPGARSASTSPRRRRPSGSSDGAVRSERARSAAHDDDDRRARRRPTRCSPACPGTPWTRWPAAPATWPSHPASSCSPRATRRHALPGPPGPGGHRGARARTGTDRHRDRRARAERSAGAGSSRPTGGSSTPGPRAGGGHRRRRRPACGPRPKPTRARLRPHEAGGRRAARTSAGDPDAASRPLRDRRCSLTAGPVARSSGRPATCRRRTGR